MKVIEKIQKMSIDTMVKFLDSMNNIGACNCIESLGVWMRTNKNVPECKGDCKICLKAWLNAESDRKI